MTSSNGSIFLVTGPLCGEFTGHRWIPLQRPVTRNFDVFFLLRLNKRLSKQSRRRRFEASLWCSGTRWYLHLPRKILRKVMKISYLMVIDILDKKMKKRRYLCRTIFFLRYSFKLSLSHTFLNLLYLWKIWTKDIKCTFIDGNYFQRLVTDCRNS